MRKPVFIVTGNGRILGTFTSLDIAAQSLVRTHDKTGKVRFVESAKEGAYLIWLYPNEGGNIPGTKHGERKLLGIVQETELYDKPTVIDSLEE